MPTARRPPLSGTIPATNQADAVLSWTGVAVYNGHGDRIASDIGVNGVQAVVDAQRVRDALAALMGATGGALVTSVAATGKPASDRYYLARESIRVAAEASPLRFLTAVDLSSDGTVQFLWPHRNDPLEWTLREPPNFQVSVSPPLRPGHAHLHRERPCADGPAYRPRAPRWAGGTHSVLRRAETLAAARDRADRHPACLHLRPAQG